jgi:hypothetical protein
MPFQFLNPTIPLRMPWQPAQPMWSPCWMRWTSNKSHYFGYSLEGWTGFGLAQHAPERLFSLTISGAHPYGSSLAIISY